jgi:AcrR family transcriptional regulator
MVMVEGEWGELDTDTSANVYSHSIRKPTDGHVALMRKKPLQRRARVLVVSLVDAAGQIVVSDGLGALTTVRVAERAGVSVGSLYQYFKNKDELVAALIERVDADLIAAVDDVAVDLLTADPKSFARALLDAAFGAFEARDGLAYELLKHWHRLDIAQGLYKFEQRMLEVLRAYALAQIRDHRVDPSPARAFIVINSVVFTLLRYISLDTRPLFKRDELLDEMATMAARLLITPQAPVAVQRTARRRSLPR